MARVNKKGSRKTTKRHSLPPRKQSVEKVYESFTAVLEDVYSEFDAFGEQLHLLDEKVERGFAEVHAALANLDRRLTALEIKVSELSDDVTAIKNEIRLIRHDLTQKVNREEFELLEERVARLEKELSVR